jgi:hypothetical protein
VAALTQTLSHWTVPYFGVQHLGPAKGKKARVSVCDYGTFSILHCWFPGCGFSPLESQHDNAETARKAGEVWLRDY